jgi:hypothetical protein
MSVLRQVIFRFGVRKKLFGNITELSAVVTPRVAIDKVLE